MTVAGKLLHAIDAGIRADNGDLFKAYQRDALPMCEDAYSPDDGVRTHLGASVLGGPCSRALWYGFRWVGRADVDPRMRRLWNRGHLEEGRFVALLRMIGVKVWTHTADGKQFQVNIVDVHAGGSSDGASLGIPDCPAVPLLNEFKTHKDSSFSDLRKKGVKESKPTHYIQMMLYMARLSLDWGLYMAVNKDTEHLHAEILQFDKPCSDSYTERARYIVYSKEPPPRISNNPSWYECKFCDFAKVCHAGSPVAKSCRTCRYVQITPDGWHCGEGWEKGPMSKQTQLAGCGHYAPLTILTHV